MLLDLLQGVCCNGTVASGRGKVSIKEEKLRPRALVNSRYKNNMTLKFYSILNVKRKGETV